MGAVGRRRHGTLTLSGNPPTLSGNRPCGSGPVRADCRWGFGRRGTALRRSPARGCMRAFVHRRRRWRRAPPTSSGERAAHFRPNPLCSLSFLRSFAVCRHRVQRPRPCSSRGGTARRARTAGVVYGVALEAGAVPSCVGRSCIAGATMHAAWPLYVVCSCLLVARWAHCVRH